ncbi:uncharacterized protein LOC120282699 [Dioscorea cayenensis subsp. rotundata]|uniref:Uncharacterized protein LOC120282699 n=1 Tax=Dioscorea cayennensis subsp. rotundata TaxID=55577 RepID=A0AB40D315_DIOCR|nr:uncharacterized protein LOC120282699 [Dioscorea cayenensis subsp. rotundata]
MDKCHSLPTTAVLVHGLQNLTIERSNSMYSLDIRTCNMVTCIYGTTLPNDSSCASCCTWAIADPSSFLIHGPTYLQNNQKVRADWLLSDKREDDLGGRSGSIVQEVVANFFHC